MNVKNPLVIQKNVEYVQEQICFSKKKQNWMLAKRMSEDIVITDSCSEERSSRFPKIKMEGRKQMMIQQKKESSNNQTLATSTKRERQTVYME